MNYKLRNMQEHADEVAILVEQVLMAFKGQSLVNLLDVIEEISQYTWAQDLHLTIHTHGKEDMRVTVQVESKGVVSNAEIQAV